MASTAATRLKSAAIPLEKWRDRVTRLPFWVQVILMGLASLLVPLYGLYELAILAIRITHWRAARKAARSSAAVEQP